MLLTTFLMPVTLLSPQAIGTRNVRVREFIVAMLVLETGMLGAFVALDLFLFYVFWEVMLIPMYLIIGIWGGERRLYASIKFVIYTMVGSLLMLVAILYLYVQYKAATGGTPASTTRSSSHLALPFGRAAGCFAAFALAFAIKVPLFPLHTWLPDAHVEAPTGGSVILAGVLLKFGIYGFLRFAMPLFPLAARGGGAAASRSLAVIGIIYGALVAFAQDDVKKLVAYSSVSHLGFVVLGLLTLNAQGVQGAIYQMLGHGITTGGLFLGVGVLYERRHTRRLAEFGGLWKQMPTVRGLLPDHRAGLGRPARAVRLRRRVPGAPRHVHRRQELGGQRAHRLLPGAQADGRAVGDGVILAAIYLLTMFQKVMFGPLDKPENKTGARHPRARDLGVRHRRRRGAGDRASSRSRSSRAPRSRCRRSSPATATGCRTRGRAPEAPPHIYPGAAARRGRRGAAAPPRAAAAAAAAAPQSRRCDVTFDSGQVLAYAPMLVLIAMGCIVLLAETFVRGTGRAGHRVAGRRGLRRRAGRGRRPVARRRDGRRPHFDGMLVVDRMALYLDAAFIVAALLTLLFAPPYLREHDFEFGEFYALVLFAAAGMVMVAHATHLVSLFIGIETMSLAVYVLTGCWRRSLRSSEGAMKYFLMGAFATGFLVYGIALVYGTTGGELSYAGIAAKANAASKAPMFFIGEYFILVALASRSRPCPSTCGRPTRTRARRRRSPASWRRA